jgi:hypothetical protein
VAGDLEFQKQPVGGFGGAGEGAGKDFGMGYEHGFVPGGGGGVLGELQEDFEVVGLQSGFERAGFAAVVAGMEAIDQDDFADARVVFGDGQDFANGAVAGAPGGESDGIEGGAGFFGGFLNDGAEQSGIRELFGVAAGTGTGLN